MARMSTQGLDDVFRELGRLGQQARPLAEKMLQAGAMEVAKGWRQAIDEVGLVKTGEMRASVAPSKQIKTEGDALYVEIYPQGKDSRGVRNAEKAFINHYGSQRVKATRFVDKAEEYGESMAVPVMAEIWERSK